MAYLLDRINAQLAKTGYKARSLQARTWLQSKIGDLRATPHKLSNTAERRTPKSVIGKLYFFYYDPKTKDSLPYYDRFPLVFPIELYPNGFLGLNLHYIHPKQRIILLDKLSELATDKRFDDRTKLKLSYQVLSSFSRLYGVNPCIKRYLGNHVQGNFVEISASEWDIAALLPVEQFEKANKNKVWADSRKKQ